MSIEPMKTVTLGQEAFAPGYGLGRVVGFCDKFPHRWIEVKPYVAGYAMKFAPENVQLVAINLEKKD